MRAYQNVLLERRSPIRRVLVLVHRAGSGTGAPWSWRVGGRWDLSYHVVVALSNLLHAGGDFDFHRLNGWAAQPGPGSAGILAGEILGFAKRRRGCRRSQGFMGVWVLRVERGLQRLQIFAHRAENCGRGLVANAGRDDARAGKAGVKGERRELAGIRRVGSGDD